MENKPVAKNLKVKVAPDGAFYTCLLKAAKVYCDEAVLVVRGGLTLHKAGAAVLKELSPFIISQTVGREWAGTRTRGSATIYKYSITGKLLDIMRERANSVYDWVQPKLPEDLSFWKGGRVWFFSIAHEKECYFSFDSLDQAQLKLLRKFPELAMAFLSHAGRDSSRRL